LLRSASSDGRIFIWKIEEGLGDDDKTKIIENFFVHSDLRGLGVYSSSCLLAFSTAGNSLTITNLSILKLSFDA